jgi:hypothetical protein
MTCAGQTCECIHEGFTTHLDYDVEMTLSYVPEVFEAYLTRRGIVLNGDREAAMILLRTIFTDIANGVRCTQCYDITGLPCACVIPVGYADGQGTVLYTTCVNRVAGTFAHVLRPVDINAAGERCTHCHEWIVAPHNALKDASVCV